MIYESSRRRWLPAALLFVGAAVGIGVALTIAQITASAPLLFPPEFEGQMVSVAGGRLTSDSWALSGANSDEGYCLVLETALSTNGTTVCGFGVETGEQELGAAGIAAPGEDLHVVFGIASARVVAVEVELANGSNRTVETASAPGLPDGVRLYLVEFDSDTLAVSVRGIAADGSVVEVDQLDLTPVEPGSQETHVEAAPAHDH